MSNKTYLRLFHGRKIDPTTGKHDKLSDWGAEGPTFECEGVGYTYGDLKIYTEDGGCEELTIHDTCVYYDGVFYGDFEVSGWIDPLNVSESYDPEKAGLQHWRRPKNPHDYGDGIQGAAIVKGDLKDE